MDRRLQASAGEMDTGLKAGKEEGEHTMRLQMLLCEASPEEIRRESNGIVTLPELLDWRTLQPMPGGLFDEQIFGTSRGGICRCRHPERIRFTGSLCATCGVEVSLARLQQEPMGRIELNAPVCPIRDTLGSPSRLALLLDITQPALEHVVSLRRDMVAALDRERLQALLPEIETLASQILARLPQPPTRRSSTSPAAPPEDLPQASDLQRALSALPKLRKRQVLLPSVYNGLKALIAVIEEQRPDWRGILTLATGAGAVRTCLHEIELVPLAHQLRHQIEHTLGRRSARAARRLEAVDFYRQEGRSLSGRILECLPVISPALRPLLLLADDKAVVSDLNDQYRRVIVRNNRLKRVLEVSAPERIVHHEQRMLQEAVDNLLCNGQCPRPWLNPQGRPYHSLDDLYQALISSPSKRP